MALRWGIVSAGKISNDFVSAVSTLPKSDHQVVAVAARSESNAKQFANQHNIPKAYEGYLKLAEDQDVDVVYIGNLNPQHFEVSKLMLEHGKHVLCEKPFTMNEKQTKTLVETAKSKQLFLMEGLWSRFFPLYTELRKLLQSGEIGEVLQVHAAFGFPIKEIDRLKAKDLGGGTILDLGIYTLQFQQFVFGKQTPSRVIAVGELNRDGVDESTNTIITYPTGQTSVLSTSSRAVYPNEAFIIGTKGTIKIPQFWCPTKLFVKDKVQEFKLPETTGTYNFQNSVGLSYEAEHVRQCIKARKLESPIASHEDSIQLAKLMDTLRKQVGVVFPADSE